MSDSLPLPNLGRSVQLLDRLGKSDTERFTHDLLEVLWAAAAAGELPNQVAIFLRDWIAHAFFEQDQETQRRLRELDLMKTWL